MVKLKRLGVCVAAVFILAFIQACTVVKVVDAAASTTVGVAKGTVKATGKVAGAVIPDGEDDDDKKDNQDD